MAERIDSWDRAVEYALKLPGTELSTSYGKPAVKVNGRAFLFIGREEESSFGVAIDLDSVELLKETDPDSFWQSPHYEGWPAVLIRLPAIPAKELREILRQSWLERAPKKLVAEFERAKAPTRQRSKLARRPSG